MKNVHAGVVHENVEPPELAQRGGHGGFGRLGISDVAAHEDCAFILACQARGDRLSARLVPLRDRNSRALAHKRPRDGFADAATRAGDHRSLSLEAPCHRIHQSTTVPSSRIAFRVCNTSGAKGWRAQAASSTSTPSPGASGTCQKPSTMRIGPRTTSEYQGTAPTISSWITWFGVETAKCNAATPAIGPSGLWGATPTDTASAIAAIFFASSTPPQ